MKLADGMGREQVELTPAGPADEPVITELFQLYAREFSAFHAVEFDADGRFVYRELPSYWTDANKHAFLISIGGETAGFMLVQQTESVACAAMVWDIAEFFVRQEYRRCGAGTQIAHRVWKQFPAPWQVRVLESNHAALQFWEHAIQRLTGRRPDPGRFERRGERWWVFSFDSTHAAGDGG